MITKAASAGQLALVGPCLELPATGSASPIRPDDLANDGADALPEEVPSFEELYDTQVDFVWRTVRRSGVPPSLVDDVVQDTFLAIAQRLDTFEPTRGRLKSWIYGIAVHVAANARRRHRRKDGPCVTGGDDVLDRMRSTAPPPSAGAETAEALRLAQEVLDQLDPDRAEVLVLADLEEMSVREIAEALALNPNTTASRLRAARRDFDDALARLRARRERTEGRRR